MRAALRGRDGSSTDDDALNIIFAQSNMSAVGVHVDTAEPALPVGARTSESERERRRLAVWSLSGHLIGSESSSSHHRVQPAARRSSLGWVRGPIGPAPAVGRGPVA